MEPPELSGSNIGRSEHAISEEAEENSLQYNFMKMRETLKEEMKTQSDI